MFNGKHKFLLYKLTLIILLFLLFIKKNICIIQNFFNQLIKYLNLFQ